ncbi:MAG: tetraacyldisaccharide 4'-kinase [Sphingobacteriaceae bacterium]|nr:tetraacyldisaccharide 4'-kinase [Sphingobacteriaceae bacterium]
MHYLRLLLLPFSVIYSLIIWARNLLFDVGFFSSKKFSIPVISIGNLAVGGSGKSPMAEYLIRLLKENYKIAVLSRGYGRKTTGFRLVKPESTSEECGDEPLQFRKKFHDITVAVSEKRVTGIEALLPDHDLVILDDAFQHRAVKPGLSILLFDYTQLGQFFLVLPAGNLREPFRNRKRADIIMVSKCPENLSAEEIERVRNRLKPVEGQQLFFSYLSYGDLISIGDGNKLSLTDIKPQTAVFLLTGIANPLPLLKKVKSLSASVLHHDYPDHHPFSSKNITKLAQEFKECRSPEKIIITTEKDAQRLQAPVLLELLKGLPVYYLPVTAKIQQPDIERFNKLIESYVKRNIQHNSLHQE